MAQGARVISQVSVNSQFILQKSALNHQLIVVAYLN